LNVATYGIAGSQIGATGTYTAANPAPATEGWYLFIAAAGSNLAVSDLLNNSQWEESCGTPAYYAAAPTAAQNATAVWTDITGSDFAVAGSPGKIVAMQLGGAFTTMASSIFTTSALENAPSSPSGPTAAQIATAVWTDAMASSDFAASGSIGLKLVQTLAAPSGIVVTLPAGPIRGKMTIYAGDDYYTTEGRAFFFTDATVPQWPNLTGAVIAWTATNGEGVSLTATCLNPGATIQTIQLQLSSANSVGMLPGPWKLEAVLPNGHNIRLANGTIEIFA
jgi:hypothetical protein